MPGYFQMFLRNTNESAIAQLHDSVYHTGQGEIVRSRKQMPHIILNPDGSQDFGLIVIVEAATLALPMSNNAVE